MYWALSVEIPKLSCTSSRAHVLHNQEGFISSSLAATSNCQKLRIAGLPGQIVNVTLIDFGDNQSKCNPKGYVTQLIIRCVIYRLLIFLHIHLLYFRYIIDLTTHRNTTICGHGSRNESNYISIGNIIEIHLNKNIFPHNDNGEYILRYKGE